MVELTLDLEPELVNRLGAEAEAHGFDGVEAYVRWIVVHRPDSNLVSQQYPGISTRLERLEARIDDLEKGTDRGTAPDFTRGTPGQRTPEDRTTADAASRSEERWYALGTSGSDRERWPPTSSESREYSETDPGRTDDREPVESDAGTTRAEPAESEGEATEDADAEEPTAVKDLFGPPEDGGADDDEIAEAVGTIPLSDDDDRSGSETGEPGDGIDTDAGRGPSLDLDEESTENDDEDS